MIKQGHDPCKIVVEQTSNVVDEQVEPRVALLFPQFEEHHRLLKLVQDMLQGQVVSVEDEIASLQEAYLVAEPVAVATLDLAVQLLQPTPELLSLTIPLFEKVDPVVDSVPFIRLEPRALLPRPIIDSGYVPVLLIMLHSRHSCPFFFFPVQQVRRRLDSEKPCFASSPSQKIYTYEF